MATTIDSRVRRGGAVGLLLLSAYHLLISWWRIGQTGFVDLPIFLTHARHFLDTGELYLDTVDDITYAPTAPIYKFPPLFGMLLLPFVRDGADPGDLWIHWVLHLALYVGAATFAVWLFVGKHGGAAAALAVVLALNLEPFIETVWRLQVELPILLLLLAAFAGLRFDRPRLSGAAIGVAAMLKVYPGFLVLYFLVRRRFRVAVWAGVGALAVTVATLLVFGLEQHRLYFLEILPLLGRELPLLNTGNVSLARHLQELGLMGPLAAKSVQTWLGLALLAISAVVVHRAGAIEDERERDTLGLALFTALMLTIMPNSWVNYQLLLLPVLLVLANAAWDNVRHRGRRLAALLLAYVPLTFYQPCAEPTVDWPCAETPFYLGLVQLPRGLHDLGVALRAFSAPVLWALLLSLIVMRTTEARARHGAEP